MPLDLRGRPPASNAEGRAGVAARFAFPRLALSETALLRLGVAALLLLLTFTVVVLAFYPGLLNPDSANMYDQALANTYADWHAPIIAWLWHLLIHLKHGPAPLLVITVAVFLISVYATLRQFFGAITAALLTSGVTLFPPVLGWVGAVIKDVWLGVAMLAAWALLGLAARCRGRPLPLGAALAGGFVALWLATASRHAALPATLPALGAVAYLALRDLPLPWRVPLRWRRLSLWATCAIGAALAAGVISVSTDAVTYRLLNTERVHIEQALFEFDLARLSLREHRLLLSPAVFPAQSLDQLAQIADRRGDGPLFGNVNFTQDPSELAGLQSTWQTQIRAHPLAYLGVRTGIYRAFLGTPGEVVCGAYQDGMIPNSQGLGIGNQALYTAVNRFVARWQTSLLGALALSSVLYTLSFFVLTPSCDYRYSWYAYVCGVLLACVLLRRLAARLWLARQRPG